MTQERPGGAPQTALFVERRTGPTDRRQSGRSGGRRRTDIAAASLVLGAIFVTGCAEGERLSPLAPSSQVSDVRTDISTPALPLASVVSPSVPGGDDVEVESDGSGDVASDPDDGGEASGATEGDLELTDFEISAAVAAGKLVLQPGTATVTTGKTRKYAVKGANGTVRWQATGGTITSNGVFKAGTKPGTFTVTASTTRQGPTKAKVTVRAPAQQPPAGSGTTPINGVAVNPGQSIQSAVNANPEGTTIVIRAGVHRRQSIRPKSGMSFIGEAGAVLDGENTTPQAFVAHSAKNVTVRGLRITKYAPPNLGGALDGVGSHGWVVEDNEIDHNANGSLRVYGIFVGSGWIIRNNKVHHNAWQGITGWNCVDTVIEGNEVYANPPAFFNDTVGDTGNIKLYGCGRITIRNNYIHDSPRFGIWVDRSQPDIKIENNRVVNHGEAGIWYEVSYRGTIRGNYVENAGNLSHYSSGWLRGGGIQVTNSPDVSVLNNTVVNSLNGIIGLQAKGYYHGKHGNSELRNFLVQGNSVTMSKGQTGIASNAGNSVYDSWNNRFVQNRYQTSGSTPFQWKGSNLTSAKWTAGPGSADSF